MAMCAAISVCFVIAAISVCFVIAGRRVTSRRRFVLVWLFVVLFIRYCRAVGAGWLAVCTRADASALAFPIL